MEFLQLINSPEFPWENSGQLRVAWSVMCDEVSNSGSETFYPEIISQDVNTIRACPALAGEFVKVKTNNYS